MHIEIVHSRILATCIKILISLLIFQAVLLQLKPDIQLLARTPCIYIMHLVSFDNVGIFARRIYE